MPCDNRDLAALYVWIYIWICQTSQVHTDECSAHPLWVIPPGLFLLCWSMIGIETNLVFGFVKNILFLCRLRLGVIDCVDVGLELSFSGEWQGEQTSVGGISVSLFLWQNRP